MRFAQYFMVYESYDTHLSFEISGNHFSASYGASEFCWQIGFNFLQHLIPCHMCRVSIIIGSFCQILGLEISDSAEAWQLHFASWGGRLNWSHILNKEKTSLCLLCFKKCISHSAKRILWWLHRHDHHHHGRYYEMIVSLVWSNEDMRSQQLQTDRGANIELIPALPVHNITSDAL